MGGGGEKGGQRGGERGGSDTGDGGRQRPHRPSQLQQLLQTTKNQFKHLIIIFAGGGLQPALDVLDQRRNRQLFPRCCCAETIFDGGGGGASGL